MQSSSLSAKLHIVVHSCIHVVHSCIFVVHSCIFGANKKLPRKVVAKAPALLIREHRMHNVLHIWDNLVSDGLGGSSGRPRHRDSCDVGGVVCRYRRGTRFLVGCSDKWQKS